MPCAFWRMTAVPQVDPAYQGHSLIRRLKGSVHPADKDARRGPSPRPARIANRDELRYLDARSVQPINHPASRQAARRGVRAMPTVLHEPVVDIDLAPPD